MPVTKKSAQTPKTIVHMVEKADVLRKTDGMIHSNAVEPEDEFIGLYESATDGKGDGAVIRPPYDPRRLQQMVQENNALSQCIEAMEVNIDGTGFDIDPVDMGSGDDEETPVQKNLTDFFNEPYPEETFMAMRRDLRRDIESTGNGYLEVIRNASDEIIFLRRIPTETMRIVRLGPPITVNKKIRRGGKETQLKVGVRERAFVQRVGTATIYFKEFGATRDIDKKTGKWGEIGLRLSADMRGTEVIHFKVHSDARTPYGVPRWINQMPSVLGSRQAEELNLEYFTSGGIPPAIVFLSGGGMSEDSLKLLKELLSGKAKSLHRGAVIEAHSTSGTVDSAGSVKVQVERFGSDRQSDSMFENYDDKCLRRIRSGFRLPPLFIGLAEDYSYATAFSSYTIAETQVFQPERTEFDNIINIKLMKILDPSNTYQFKSRALTVANIDAQLKLLELSKDKVEPESFMKEVNEIGRFSLAIKEGIDELENMPPNVAQLPVGNGQGDETQAPSGGNSSTPTRVQVSKVDPLELIDLARDWARVAGLEGVPLKEQASIKALKARMSSLNDRDREILDNLLATRSFSAAHYDYEGAGELAGCATDCVNR